MSYAIDTFGDISSFAVLVPPPPPRKFRFVALGVTVLGCVILATGLVAASMAATWLALDYFGSAPDISAKAPAARKPVALAEPQPAAAHVLVDIKPSPITEPRTVPPQAAAAASVAPPLVAAAPEIAPLAPVVTRMASLPPDTATPRVARLPFALKFASAPLGAVGPGIAPPVAVAPEIAPLPPIAPRMALLPPDAVPLPPDRK